MKPAVTTEDKIVSGLRERDVLLWFDHKMAFTGPSVQTIVPNLMAQFWEAVKSQEHET